MTKPCPPDLAAFKHEPADYEQPVEAVAVELLPCPFCGGDGRPAPETVGWACGPVWCVICPVCGGKSGLSDTEAQAIAAWNTRTQAAAMQEALERISDAHLPDQPATSSLDETEWAIQHIRRIRAIARNALSGDSARPQANEAMREALERIAATDFDSPPWQAVEAEIKQIALSALSGDSA